MMIAEFAARVRRLKKVLPDIEVKFHQDEGLTLVYRIDGILVTLTGEPEIIEVAERNWRVVLSETMKTFDDPVSFTPFASPPLERRR